MRRTTVSTIARADLKGCGRTTRLTLLMGCFLLCHPVWARSADTPASGEAKPATDKRVADAGGASWKSLFDGQSLRGWRPTDFAGRGEIRVEKDFKGAPALVIEQGGALSGVNFTNDLPRMDYEVTLEAMKVSGSDFFCGLTFPYGESHGTLIVGGWGGAALGISSVDGNDASMNETTRFMRFDPDRWYAIRLRVTAARIEAWIDKDKVIDLETRDKRISMRSGEIEESIPFGVATWQTTAALRNIQLRSLPAPAGGN